MNFSFLSWVRACLVFQFFVFFLPFFSFFSFSGILKKLDYGIMERSIEFLFVFVFFFPLRLHVFKRYELALHSDYKIQTYISTKVPRLTGPVLNCIQ